MRLRPYSFNGNLINDGVNFKTVIPLGNPEQAGADVEFIARTNSRPAFAGKNLSAANLTIEVMILTSDFNTKNSLIKQYFDVEDTEPHKLICKDVDNSDKQYYVYCTPISMVDFVFTKVTVTLSLVDPVWRAETATSVNWGITATGQTKDLTTGSNTVAKPVLTITPTSAKTGGYGYKSFLTVKNVHTNAFVDYPFNLTNAGLDTATLVSGGKMQADGDDLRIFVDGQEVSRWLQGINTANTKVWINLNLKPKAASTISVAIAASGAITTITVAKTSGGLAFLKACKSANGIAEIGSELFTYTGVDLTKYQLTGVTRASKGTSEAAHAGSDAITYIEHDIWLMYGNSSVAAPDQNETKKPVIKLTSTNGSWIYEEFASEDGLRTGSFKPSRVSSSGKESTIYTDTLGEDISPATAMGMLMLAYQINGLWKAETANLQWYLYHPAGITHVSSNGKHKRSSTSYPALSALQKGTSISAWKSQWNLSSPASLNTWTTWTKSAEALGATYNHLKFVLSGSIGSIANNAVYYEVLDATLTLDAAKIPTSAVGAEQANYWLEAKITNNTTGKWLQVAYLMGLNTSLVIDCDNKTVSAAGANLIGAVTFSDIRQSWLDLLAGANQLQWDDTGTNGVTVAISYQDRNS